MRSICRLKSSALIILVCLLEGCAISNSYSPEGANNVYLAKPELIISTNPVTFSEKLQPSSFFIGSETIYAVSKWSNLKGIIINYECKMYDGEGDLAFSMSSRIKPDSSEYYYQSNYGPNPGIDKSGRWRIELYVDGNLVADRNLKGIDLTNIK